MREKRMLEMLGNVEDCYIEEANPLNWNDTNNYMNKRMKRVMKILCGGVAACMCLFWIVGYGVTLYTKDSYNATNINTEDAIASIPYEDTTVYVFQKEIESSHEHAFEVVFTYKGIDYSLSIDTNDETYISEMVQTILGESDRHVFSDILGFDSYYVKGEEPFKHFLNWKYFVKINDAEICIAEVFGDITTKPQVYQKDLDGDGVAELICNSMYGTGAQRVYVFRNHNGVIEVGYLCYDLTDESLFPGITNQGSSYIQEVYHPEKEVFEVSYPVEEGTKSVFLQDIKRLEFVPYKLGYF